MLYKCTNSHWDDETTKIIKEAEPYIEGLNDMASFIVKVIKSNKYMGTPMTVSDYIEALGVLEAVKAQLLEEAYKNEAR
jgi:hypothetical protein